MTACARRAGGRTYTRTAVYNTATTAIMIMCARSTARVLKLLCLIVFSWFRSRMGAAEVLDEFPQPAVPDDGSPRRRRRELQQDKEQDKEHREDGKYSDAHDDEDVLTVEQARAVIKQLRDRCRFQTHQTLLWRKKAKMQVR